MADQALIQAVRDLTGALKAQAGSMTFGGSKNVLDAGGQQAGGQHVGDLLKEQIEGMRSQTEGMKSLAEILGRSTKDQRDTFAEHAKKLEYLGLGLTAVAPLVSSYAKYGITRPVEMLGGAYGQVGGRMLEREQGAGNIVSGIATALGTLIFGPLAGMAIAGVAAVGGSAIVGKAFRDESVKASAQETAARMGQERLIGARESMYLNYRLGRGNVAAAGMGGESARTAADELALMGVSADEAVAISSAVRASGARGYGKFSMARAREITNMGYLGEDVAANAIALQAGNRTGFSERELIRSAERTGWQLPQTSQAAIAARQQTFMFGGAAGNRVFDMASRTTAASMTSTTAAMGMLAQGAQSAAGAASGNEASEMILFQQFQQANPGSSYMDFLEAKSMGEKDHRWVKMMSGATKTFGAMGQIGGLLGVGVGVFQGAGAGARAEGIRTWGEAAGDITKADTMRRAGSYGGSASFRQLAVTDKDQNIALGNQVEKEFAPVIKNVTDGLSKIAASADSVSKATTDAADLMARNSVLVTTTISNTMAKWAEAFLDSYRPDNAQKKQ